MGATSNHHHLQAGMETRDKPHGIPTPMQAKEKETHASYKRLGGTHPLPEEEDRDLLAVQQSKTPTSPIIPEFSRGYPGLR